MTTIDSAPTALSHGRPGRSEGALGQFAGQQVQVDAGALLGEAARQSGLLHAVQAEARHPAERRKEARKSLEMLSAEQVLAYMTAARVCDDAGALDALAARLLTGEHDAAQQASAAFDAPTSQFMALHYALRQGERDGAAPELLGELHEALQELEMLHGPGIRADINTLGTAAAGGAGRIDIARFQASYRDVVLGGTSLAATLKLVLERFGDQDFAAGLQRLTQALGQDIAAASPSCAPARLQTLLGDLYQLGVVATVLDGCKALQAALEKNHGVTGLAPVALMRGLVDLSAEKWATAQRFTGLSERCGAHQAQAQVHFLTAVKGLLGTMPAGVFAGDEQRQSVMHAAQDALDAAIDREDEEEV